MKLYSLKIKDTVFRVAVVTGEKEMKKGLSGAPKLGKNKGLLFHFGEPQEVTMNMKGMRHPIDMIFIGKDRKVIKVKTMKMGLTQITVPDVMCVLEVNKGEGEGLQGSKLLPSRPLVESMGMTVKSDKAPAEKPYEEKIDKGLNIIVKITHTPKKEGGLFKRGGSFKIYEEDVKSDKDAMQVLDDTGRVLMNIVGGERIFSIEHTDKLVELAKKVDRGEADEEELGKLMEEIIDIQNTQEPEYV